MSFAEKIAVSFHCTAHFEDIYCSRVRNRVYNDHSMLMRFTIFFMHKLRTTIKEAQRQ